MALAFDRSARARIVVPSDRSLPVDQHTVWILRPLTVFESLDLESKHANAAGVTGTATYAIDLLRICLVGWENLKLPDGTLASFVAVDGRATDATIEYAQGYLADLFREARTLNSVTQDEAGK